MANMTAIPASVFANEEVYLRIWFDDGTNGSQRLSPDQRIAAVGYAMMAASAATVPDGAITSAKLAPGAVTADKLAASVSFAKAYTGTIEIPVYGTRPYSVTFPEPFDEKPFFHLVPPIPFPKFPLPERSKTGVSGEIVLPDGFGVRSLDKGSVPSMRIIDSRPAIAYSGSERTLLAISETEDGSGPWNTQVVDIERSWCISLGSLDGRPIVFYTVAPRGVPKVAISEKVDGSGAWHRVRFAQANASITPNGLAVVSGRPAIAYTTFSGLAVFAINSKPDGTGEWTHSPIARGSISVAEVDGRPAVSYQSADGHTFAINEKADGSGAWIETIVDTSGTGGIVVFNGKPAVSYSTADELKFAINENADGSGAWNKTTVFPAVSELSLAVVGGKPAISFSGTIAISESPDGSGKWSVQKFDIGWDSSLIDLVGEPAVAYTNSTNSSSSRIKFWVPPKETYEIQWIAVGR